MNKIKLLYNNNPVGFMVFIGINIIFCFSGLLFIKTNTILGFMIYVIISGFGIMINRIIFQKNYLEKIIKDVNNIFTILANAIKCYIKYFIYSCLLSFIVLLAVIIIYILLKFENIQDISNIDNKSLFFLILPVLLLIDMFIFYKLIFIEHILVQKDNNIKIKDLVKKSFEIILSDKYYIFVLYIIYNILINSFVMIRILLEMSAINNIYINLALGIMHTLINCIYVMLILIFYGEYKINDNKENI